MENIMNKNNFDGLLCWEAFSDALPAVCCTAAFFFFWRGEGTWWAAPGLRGKMEDEVQFSSTPGTHRTLAHCWACSTGRQHAEV